MRLEVISDTRRFHELQHDWDRLLSTDGSVGLPLTHAWLYTWWQVFGTDKQLSIHCVYSEEKIVAIGPFMQEKSNYRGIPVTIQKLMANGHSPYCDLIFRGGLPTKQKAEIIDLIIKNCPADILQFSKIPENSFVLQYLKNKPENYGYHVGIKPGLVTPIIRIQGRWDDFIQEKSRKFRKSLNNKLNKFNKLSDYKISCVQIPDSSHPYLGEIVDISKKSWKRKINNDLGTNSAGREFLLKLAVLLGPKDMLNIWILHNGNKPVAFEYHLNYRGVTYPIRADFDEEYRSISPGSILEYTALKTLFEGENIQEYYSCADDYWYLNNWTTELKKHFNVEVFMNGWKAQILYHFEYSLLPKLRKIRDYIYKPAASDK